MFRDDAPIPGANFTSDTKNYPWHRPPEFTDLDKAIEHIADKLMEKDSVFGLLTMLENGISVVELTDMFLTSGIGAGKWTLDFAFLLAGPTSHIIYLMAKAYGVECDLGINDDDELPLTKEFFDGFKQTKEKSMKPLKEIDLELVKEAASVPSRGFMPPATEEVMEEEEFY